MLRTVVDVVGSAWRNVSRRPQSSLWITATLAIGIGASTVIFAVAHSVLLRPLPYSDPASLVMLWQGRVTGPTPARGIATSVHVSEWGSRNTVFEAMAALRLWQYDPVAQVDLVTPSGTERLRGSFATPNFFDLLGVTAAHGRTFTEADSGQAVVLSDGLWRRAFGADPDIIGRTVDLAVGRDRRRQAFTVIGVLPRAFRFTYPRETEAWMMLPWTDVLRGAMALEYAVIARLRPNVTLAQAGAAMETMAISIGQERGGAFVGNTVRLEPIHEYAVGNTREPMLLLSGTTLLLVVVAVVNVASLMFFRTISRRHELTVRASLGAGRLRLLGEYTLENAFVAGAGGLAGFALALTARPAVTMLFPTSFPRGDEIAIESTALLWGISLAAVVGTISGILPARDIWRIESSHILKENSGSTTAGPKSSNWRTILSSAQVAMVFCLLVGAGLLLRSFWMLQNASVGFEPSNLMVAEMRLLGSAYNGSPERRRAFVDQVLEQITATPGIIAAGSISTAPFGSGPDQRSSVLISASERVLVSRRAVDAAYFGATGIKLKSGELFTGYESPSSPQVAIVSESLARIAFAKRHPIGEILRTATESFRIVGVVDDVKSVRIDEDPSPLYYVSRLQSPSELVALVGRVGSESDVFSDAVRRAVQRIDPQVPVLTLNRMEAMIAGTYADRRFYAAATSAFGLVTLLLAATGIYGVVGRSVSERSRELAIRLALGSTANALTRLVLFQNAKPIAIGLVAGGLLLTLFTTFLRRFLYGISSFDVLTYAIAGIAVALAFLIACYIPSRRIGSTNPLPYLRQS